MKFLIATLVLILTIQSPSIKAQSTTSAFLQYVPIPPNEVAKNQVIQDLRDLGADFVIQKGVFANTTLPLPGSYYEVTETESVEQKDTSTATYYRFTVILTETDNLAVVRANYVIGFRPSTGGFLVTYYNYDIIGGDPDAEQSVGGPSFVDVRPLNNGTSDLSPLLNSSIEYIVADATEKGQIPESNYTLRYVYNAHLANSGYPPTYVFLVRLMNDEGMSYRVEIVASEGEEEGEGEEEFVNEFGGEDSGEGFGEEEGVQYLIYPNAL